MEINGLLNGVDSRPIVASQLNEKISSHIESEYGIQFKCNTTDSTRVLCARSCGGQHRRARQSHLISFRMWINR